MKTNEKDVTGQSLVQVLVEENHRLFEDEFHQLSNGHPNESYKGPFSSFLLDLYVDTYLCSKLTVPYQPFADEKNQHYCFISYKSRCCIFDMKTK